MLESTHGVGVVLAVTSQEAESVIEAFRGLKANFMVQEFIREAGGADLLSFGNAWTRQLFDGDHDARRRGGGGGLGQHVAQRVLPLALPQEQLERVLGRGGERGGERGDRLHLRHVAAPRLPRRLAGDFERRRPHRGDSVPFALDGGEVNAVPVNDLLP